MTQRSKQAAFVSFLFAITALTTAAAPLPLPNNSVTYFPMTIWQGNDKHGLAWSWIGRDRDAWLDYNVTWYYHWSTKTIAGVEAEFVPMIWDDRPSLKEQALRDISRDYCGYLLVANEPEFTTQANMTIAELISLIEWVAVMYPCAKLIAPQTHVCWYELNPPTPPCPRLTGERFTVEGFIRTYQATHEGANPPLYGYGLHYGAADIWPDRLARLLEQLQVEPVFWYTEFNYCGQTPERLSLWLNHLNNNPLVERYAYWTNLQEGDHCVLADFETRILTASGREYARWGE